MKTAKDLIDAGVVELRGDATVRVQLLHGYFYHICCDCHLVHRVHVRGVDTLEMRWEHLPELPSEDVDRAAVEVLEVEP